MSEQPLSLATLNLAVRDWVTAIHCATGVAPDAVLLPAEVYDRLEAGEWAGPDRGPWRMETMKLNGIKLVRGDP